MTADALLVSEAGKEARRTAFILAAAQAIVGSAVPIAISLGSETPLTSKCGSAVLQAAPYGRSNDAETHAMKFGLLSQIQVPKPWV